MLRDGGHMDERDYQTYVSLFGHMSNFMKKPNIIVHLDVKPEQSMERIKIRARGVETGITIEYLQALYNAYEVCRSVPVLSLLLVGPKMFVLILIYQ
jgi:deoxyadenosine/deoxycytidine kinase